MPASADGLAAASLSSTKSTWVEVGQRRNHVAVEDGNGRQPLAFSWAIEP